MNFPPDEAEYALLTMPGSKVVICQGEPQCKQRLIEILGNRAGLLSLGNVLLWLHANCWRRELLSLTALPFVQPEGAIAISVRVLNADDSGQCGWVRLRDNDRQYEWELPEDDLLRLGLLCHRLGCRPEHGYDVIPFNPSSVGPESVSVRIELCSNREQCQP